jgi:hypothetical protein
MKNIGKILVQVVAAVWIGTGIAPASHAEIFVPAQLTLLAEAELYNHSEDTEAPVAGLSPLQILNVKNKVDAHRDDNKIWYEVETWLGDKWILGDAGSLVEGVLKETNYKARTIFQEWPYNEPGLYPSNPQPLSPQEVQVTGILADWYRIQTEFGEQWLYRPRFMGEIKEEPVQLTMGLTRQEQLYTIPYVQQAAETLDPQTIQVIGQWDTGEMAYRFREIIWYKIHTAQGDRWFLPRNELIHIQPSDMQIDLPTGAYGSDSPETDEGKIWFEPGSVKTYEQWNDWYHVHTASGYKWINPEQALRKRPLGTTPAHGKFLITQDTATYNAPSPASLAHPKGFYAAQEIETIAKWTAWDGLEWYLFQGYDGDLWVPVHRDASDQSLAGSWNSLQLDPMSTGTHGTPFDTNLYKDSQRHAFERSEGIPFSIRIANTFDHRVETSKPIEFQLQMIRLNGDPEEALRNPEQQEIVWKHQLPALDAAFQKRMSARAIEVQWDQRDQQGHLVAPGEYVARIVTPIQIEYKEDGKTGTQIQTEKELHIQLASPARFGVLPNHN